MIRIGAHVSSAGGLENAGKEALSIGADTFQIFLRNPRGAGAKKFDPNDMENLRTLMIQNNFGKMVAHAPYTMNPCSTNPRVRELATIIMNDDLARMEYLPGNYYNFHPGSAMGQDHDTVIDTISDFLNNTIKPDQQTVVLLETMSGKGSEVGGTFQDLRDIIDRVDHREKVGVCFDSCHMWDAGYDIKNNLDKVLEEFDRIVGLDYVKAVHINDSKNDLGSGKDRHDMIGKGYLGYDGIIAMITNDVLKDMPFILETPTDLEGHGHEIMKLRELIGV